MLRSIFVNTDGWLALYNPQDPNHEAALTVWQDLRHQPVRLITTDYVLDEVFTALKMRGSLEAAQAFHELVINSSVVRLFMVDSVMFDRAWRVFSDNEHPGWTFTDCASYAVIQYLGISEVLTFDQDFSTPGLVTIPGRVG